MRKKKTNNIIVTYKMMYNFIKDGNDEPIRFIGVVSKKVYSKKNESFIGVNINNVTITDNFYQEEYKRFITKMSKEFQKEYKKKISRQNLVLFAPKIRNYELDNLDRFDIGTQVIFTVSSRMDKEKNKENFTVHNLSVYYSKENKNTSLVNSMSNGIHYKKNYISVDDLRLSDERLHSILAKINSHSDFNDIIKLQGVINKFITEYMKKNKMAEYEKECKRIEELKKQELEQSKNSLQKAIDNMQSVYKNCIS